MLGDLCAEEDGGGEFSHQVTAIKSIEKPPCPRNETNLCGLRNQGATCYLNVLIQTLLYTPEFREPLFRLTPQELNLPVNYNDETQISTSGASSLKVRKIIVELQRLFAEMLLINQQACSSIRLTDSFGWQSNEAIDHQDVHELNRLLFDAIQKSLQGTIESNLIRSCYEGSTINYTQCKTCQKIFQRSEYYQDLSLVVQDSPNLHTSLASMFTIREQLIGDNQYQCSACHNKLCDAEKWAKISKLPPILTLPLQRFVYDIKTGSRQKKTTHFEFPFEIDLKEFCEESVPETNYELFAVVIHKGTCYSGHYYGYIKDIDQIGTWVRPPPKTLLSPSMKSPDKQKPIDSQNNSSASPNNNRTTNELTDVKEETMKKLDLVKTLLLSCDNWITIECLLQTYRENTATSWNRTRGVHTSFTKFLRSYPDVFEIDDKRVRLVEKNCSMDVDTTEVDQMDYESSQVENSSNNDIDNDEHWFCFDDSIVKCVTQEQIKKHYGQNDCAYMLFYRQKDRHRSKMDSSDNSLYSIPQWLLDEISEKNKILDEKRDVYDKRQNQILVTIYPNEWFEVIDDCRLNLNNNNQVLFPDRYGEHVFDKRIKINDFISKLKNVYGIESRFYIATKLRSGQLHVINELIRSNDDKIIDKSDLANYRNVIVYTNSSSLPDTVLQGEEFEPIMLNIVYGFPDANLHTSRLQPIRHISKNTTLLELKQMLYHDYYGNYDAQNLKQIRMGKLNLEEKNNRKSRREYKPDEEKQTLAQLRLQDGDTLGIDDKSSFVPNWRNVSSNTMSVAKNQLSLTVKNSIDTSNTKPMTYSCLNTTLIEEVKLMAIQAFNLSIEPCMCRLYIDDSDFGHIPLYDHQTVDSIEFKQNNTNLCLKSGQSLKENDILLYILSDRDPCTLELVVDKNITLSHLWLLIKGELYMDDDDNEYHLIEVKPTLSDDGAPLNDFDRTLAENELTNGAQLAMRPGSVAKKNYVRLKVSRIIGKTYTPNEAIHTNPKLEMIEIEDLFQLPVISPFNVLRESIAKYIEFIPPAGYGRDVRPLEFIRLYSIEENKAMSVIHEPSLVTLKQAKVQDLDSYAFELLSHPESLAKKDFLLNVVYKDDDRPYFEYHFEIHWPLKENIIAKYEYLEQLVLTQLSSFMTNKLHYKNVSKNALKVTLARYFPDRAQWIIIDRVTQSNNNQSANKKSKTMSPSSKALKSNLRLEPYKLTDLTVIGVLEGECLSVSDFDTPYDQQKRKEMEHEKQEKRLNRERSKADNDRNQTDGTSLRRRSPQNTMRIAVDDFDS